MYVIHNKRSTLYHACYKDQQYSAVRCSPSHSKTLFLRREHHPIYSVSLNTSKSIRVYGMTSNSIALVASRFKTTDEYFFVLYCQYSSPLNLQYIFPVQHSLSTSSTVIYIDKLLLKLCGPNLHGFASCQFSKTLSWFQHLPKTTNSNSTLLTIDSS